MSDVVHIVPTLLGAERNGGDLEITVDLDPESASPESPSISTLSFSGCAVSVETTQKLNHAEAILAESIGSAFEWEIEEGEAWLYVDYEAHLVELPYSSFEEQRTQPSTVDLHRRVSGLAKRANRLFIGEQQLQQRHSTLIETLSRLCESEANRAARKLPFLAKRGARTTDSVRARAEVFEQVWETVKAIQQPDE